jgi:hypothetical protein
MILEVSHAIAFLCGGAPGLTCPSAIYIHSIFPKRLALQDAVETGPPPQLAPAAHLHNLPTQRLTRKAINARPARFPLDLEGFVAQLAITLRHHTLKRIDYCTGVVTSGRETLGLLVTKFHDHKKVGSTTGARRSWFVCRRVGWLWLFWLLP